MNRYQSLYPRLGLVIAGVALGLIARQVLGPPPEEDPRPARTIDRPIAEGLELAPDDAAYVPIDVPVEKFKPKLEE